MDEDVTGASTICKAECLTQIFPRSCWLLYSPAIRRETFALWAEVKVQFKHDSKSACSKLW